MSVFLLSNFVILLTIGCLTEARPRDTLKKPKYVGCVYPYQFVNPYYHPSTARSCANLLLDRSDVAPPNPEEYSVGCDCISGFALNFQGLCIDESECTIFEAFGALVDAGKFVLPSSKEHKKLLQEHHEKAAQENQRDRIKNEKNWEKSHHIIKKFFTENPQNQMNKPNIGNEVDEKTSESDGNDEEGNDEGEDECCECYCCCCDEDEGENGEENGNEDDDCDCSDDNENENTTDEETASLVPTDESNAPSSENPKIVDKIVDHIQKIAIEKNQAEKEKQAALDTNMIE